MVTKDNSVLISVKMRWVPVSSPATYTMAVQDMALLPDMARLGRWRCWWWRRLGKC